MKYAAVAIVAGVIAGVAGYFARPAPAPPTPTPPPPKGPLTATCVQPHAVGYTTAAALYEGATGIKVDVYSIPYPEHFHKVVLDIEGKVGKYHSLEIWYPHIGDMVAKNLCVELTELVERDKAELNLDDYFPMLWENYSVYDGKIYSLPVDGDVHTLIYRKDVLEKYGYIKNGEHTIDTWEKFNEAVAEITRGEAPKIYGCSLMLMKWPIILGSTYANRLGAFGGEWFHKDGTPAINDEPAVKALQNMIDCVPHAVPGTLTYAFDEQRMAFFNGTTAMMEIWGDMYMRARDPAEAVPEVNKNVDIGILPGRRPGLDAGFGVFISPLAPDLELAWDWAKFVSGTAVQKAICMAMGGFDPVRKSVYEDKDMIAWAPRYIKAMKESLAVAFGWPRAPGMSAMMEALCEEMSLALEGKKKPEKALDDAAAKWTEILGIKK
jgi:multiple sugar transport system substrate-binding protein